MSLLDLKTYGISYQNVVMSIINLRNIRFQKSVEIVARWIVFLKKLQNSVEEKLLDEIQISTILNYIQGDIISCERR